MHWLLGVFQKRLGFSQLVAIGLKDSAAALSYSRAVHSSHPLDFVIVNNDLASAAALLASKHYPATSRAVLDRKHFLVADGAAVPRAALN